MPFSPSHASHGASFYGAQQSALQQWFQAVDTDRSGRISTQELQKALQMGGLNFSLKLVASLAWGWSSTVSRTAAAQE